MTPVDLNALRQIENHFPSTYGECRVIRAAADELAALRQELAKARRIATYDCYDCAVKERELAALRKEVEEQRTAANILGQAWSDTRDREDALRTEVEALRKVAEAAGKLNYEANEGPGDDDVIDGLWIELAKALAAWRGADK